MILSDVCQSDICLSVCLSRTSDMWPKSRTERPRKTKKWHRGSHVTLDSDTSFRVKRSRSRSPGHFTHRDVYASGICSGHHGNVFTVGTYCYVGITGSGAVSSAAQGASAPTEGGEGWGILWWLLHSCFFLNTRRTRRHSAGFEGQSMYFRTAFLYIY